MHKYSYPSEQQIYKAMGRPLIEFYEVLLPGSDAMKLAKTHRQFQADNPTLIKLFPKIKKTLELLKTAGFPLAAVSNRTRDSLLHSLKLTEIFDYFDIIIAADDVVNTKPHQEPLLAALKFLQMKPNSAYMIGDTENDILAGKNAKVKTIGVTYGWLGKDITIHNPDYVINDIEEVFRIFRI